MKMLNTILIGAQKAGTSSLYSWLGQHPEICAPELIKDYHYFTVDKLQQRGFAFLENSMLEEGKAHARIYMQGGVNYIFQNNAAEALKQYNPEMKLILVLRNPIERAKSAYKYFKQLGQENSSFQEAIDKEFDGRLTSHEDQMNFSYLAHGLYYMQLQKYLKYFEKNRLKIVLFEDLKETPLKVCNEIFEFLNVEKSFIPEARIKNQSGKPIIPGLNKLFFGKGIISRCLKFFAKVIPIKLKVHFVNWIREINKKKGVSTQEKLFYNEKQLENYFREDIKKLSGLLGINLAKKWDIE